MTQVRPSERQRHLYEALADALRDEIGSRPPGAERLPTEAQLCQVHGVSLVTVRRALQILEHEGLVDRVRRRGTFIRRPSATQRASARGMSVAINIEGGEQAHSFRRLQILGATRFLARHHASLVVRPEPQGVPELPGFLDGLVRSRIAGLLFYGFNTDEVRAVAELSGRRSLPTVLINVRADDLDLDYVTCSNGTGGRLAADYLLDLGHRRGAFLYTYGGRMAHDLSTRERWQGFRDRMASAGGQAFCVATWQGEAGPPMERLLARLHETTAVFCANDSIAAQLQHALLGRGLRIPEDISVIGFDNNVDVCGHAPVPMTTIAQPAREMGARAAQLLWERLTGLEPPRPRRIQLVPELVVRASAAPPTWSPG